MADKIFRKLLHNRSSLGPNTPKRIIRIMAECYVYNNFISQQGIADSYGISRCSVAALLKRGIEEKILAPELADKVISKSCYKHANYLKYCASSNNA